MECRECGSAIRLGRFERLCPVCHQPLSQSGTVDRRAAESVPFVRDWITQLRWAGGDFDKRAARSAGEIAFRLLHRGLSPGEIFQVARSTYYEAMDQRGKQTHKDASLRVHSRRDTRDRELRSMHAQSIAGRAFADERDLGQEASLG